MWYVEVMVADGSYQRSEPLTYSSTAQLSTGAVVLVPLQKKQVLGMVTAVVSKPAFTVKPILESPLLPSIPKPLQDLARWLRAYYPAPLGLTAQLFLPKDLPNKTLDVRELDTPQSTTLPALTEEQRVAIDSISASGLHILHGDTGSGKTRVYIELAMQNLARGRSSIILSPEIGLTSQLEKSFMRVFSNRVFVLHSALAESKRRELWQYLLTTMEPLIVIGARSALFSPLHNVGLIVVDEAHEPAYKQDQAPYYQTANVAAKLSSLHQARLVLGSATPLVSDYYIATLKKRPVIRMHQLAANVGLKTPPPVVVDLKDRGQFSKSMHLSDLLVEATHKTLERKEQVLLFLNRRGTARVVFCERCGWQAICPYCDLPLIYHGDVHIMRCHSCAYKTGVLSSCPECGHTTILFKSIGTKAIAAETQRLFPDARIMRFDTDNRKSERLESNYETVHAGDVDIIVGTQTLAKGLDLPKLGLVGVVAADTGLYFPDFSAQERTYQLLSQVIGRVGRGHRRGQAIIQTFEPSSPLISAVIAKDWHGLYEKELGERKQFLFPPFCYLLKLTCRRATSDSAQRAALNLAATLQAQKLPIRIEGPAPAFYQKVDNKFAWQLIVKSKDRGRLTDIIKRLPSGWFYDIDPTNLL